MESVLKISLRVDFDSGWGDYGGYLLLFDSVLFMTSFVGFGAAQVMKNYLPLVFADKMDQYLRVLDRIHEWRIKDGIKPFLNDLSDRRDYDNSLFCKEILS